MEPRFVSKPAFTVVGVKYRGRNDNNEIPALWESFFPQQAARIEDKLDPTVSYGVEDNMDMASGEFDYLAGYEVSGGAQTPEGMERWDLPPQTYAVFRGPLSQIHAMYHSVYHDWLPRSGYRRAPGPEFELYDRDFDPVNGKLDMYLYVPVTPVSRAE